MRTLFDTTLAIASIPIFFLFCLMLSLFLPGFLDREPIVQGAGFPAPIQISEIATGTLPAAQPVSIVPLADAAPALSAVQVSAPQSIMPAHPSPIRRPDWVGR